MKEQVDPRTKHIAPLFNEDALKTSRVSRFVKVVIQSMLDGMTPAFLHIC